SSVMATQLFAHRADQPALALPQRRAAWWVRWLPRTMTGMVAIGCLLAALPMLTAVILSGVMLQQQAQLSEALLAEGLRIERVGAQLLKELENLERGTLQYIALNDAELLPVLDRRSNAVIGILREIDEGSYPPGFKRYALDMLRDISSAGLIWTAQTADVEALTLITERLRRNKATAETMIAMGRNSIDLRVQALQQQMSESRRMTRICAVASVPLTALLAFGFSLAVTRPLKILRSGISALGTSNYSNPVSIEYPREMSRLGEKLDWLRRRLSMLEADKDRFLMHVSHELKTPLSSIREGADLMRDGTLGSLGPAQAEVVQIVFDASVELEQQIRNLIAYAEWRDGMRHATSEWFDAAELVREVLAAHRLALAKRTLRIELSMRPGLRLYGQRVRLRIALDNLISNAIKHAPSSSAIELTLECRDGRCMTIVRDHGRGIPESERERMLEPFVRGTEKEETAVRGTGVGLSIVVDTVNAHGGELEIQDAGPGARMAMAWPHPPVDE
ncbi:MAG TPA: HAMP domain-containing sensor histidine kinase, partial [Fontimonas sp.]